MLEYADKVLIPYFKEARKSLQLPEDHQALVILDVYAAHRMDNFLDRLGAANIAIVFVPGGCTGEL
ncbi:UNVERIFIED_CONTAM: hypothetical protein FKN15_070361 [Acipenser sinensis]